MSLAPGDLGELTQLATALGLVDGSGDFRDDWLSRPGHYLSSVLADPAQRDAMVSFVDDVLGGSKAQTQDDVVWLPIVEHDDPHVSFFAVLDSRPATHIAIGIGVRLTSGPPAAPTSTTQLHVPVFRAAKNGQTIPDPILIGTPGAVLRLQTEIATGGGPPLGGISLVIDVPTDLSESPAFSLALKQLQLPGSSAPRDLEVSLDKLDELDDAALELVLGVVRAQADALGPGSPLAAVAALLGLVPGGDIPALPIRELTTQGVGAFAGWFTGVVSSPSSRAAWTAHLAALLSGTVAGDEITVALGIAQLTIGIEFGSGSGGRPIVTPHLDIRVAASDSALARVTADLFRLDLSTGSAHALPRLSAFVHAGLRPDGGTRLLSGDPQVDAVRIGMTLDEARRPAFLMAADGVTVTGHQYATLDLSSPEAIASVGATLLEAVVDDLLAQLGPIGDALKVVIGLRAPASDPGVTLLSLPEFLRDPLGAIREYWRGLVRNHAAAVPEILATLRDFIADQSSGGTPIEGAGTDVDPWRIVLVQLVQPIELHAWRSADDRLDLAIAARSIADKLGQRCTRVELRLTAGLASLDFAAGQATFLGLVDVRLLARARGSTRALIDLDAIALTADAIGLAARWTPATGLGFEVLAPNLSVLIEDRAPIPVALPVIGSDGSVALDAAGWDALEALAGLLASAAPIPWIGELAEVLGWSQTRAATPRLRLADLATDAPAAVRQWLLAIAVEEGGRLADGLAVLARVLTGTRGAFGKFDGTGRPNDPWRVPLFPRGPSPELAAWLVPDGPDLPVTNAPSVIRRWRPGDPGLQPPILARSLQSEAVAAPDVAALVSGRDNLADGLAQLAARWTGTDGRLVPPTTDPPGVTVQRVENLPSHALLNSVRLTEVLGEGTINLVRIAVVERDKDVPWPNVPAGRLVDVRQPGLGPDAFVAPSPAPGEWFIALAPRSDARLANGDPDGVLGQAARLRTVLAPFGTLTDPVVLAAHDTAGHAVLIAADDLPFVQTVVTAGTAFTPVAFTILDEQPGADALRLLQCLLPPSDPEEPDDGALALGRALMDALTPLLSADDPAREIRLPAAGIPTPRSGLAVTALFAVMDEDAVFAGMTAIVAAGLAARARARDDADRRPVTGVRVGLRLPVAAAVTGVTVSGHGVIELGGADLVEGAGVASSARGLTAHLELRRAGGWLAGGPDPARGPGPRPDQEIRWLEADVQLPFGEGDGRAVIVLHDARVFAIAREQWIVGVQSSGNDPSAATPNLPEVRVLLSLVAAEIDAARTTSPAVDAAFTLLRALNVIGPQGGSVPDAIDHLLNDPAPHVREALQSDERRGQLSSALTQLLSGLPSLSFDLADGRFALDASSTPGDRGLSAWSAHVEGRSSGALQCHVEIGSSGSTAAGGALIRLDTGPLRVDLDWTRPGSPQPERIALWPSPDGAPAARAIAQVIAAECARASLEYLRSLDPSARTVLDAAFDAIGLLGAADQSGAREVLLPVGLIVDPFGWLRHGTALGGADGFNAARVAAFLDAVKPVAGFTGGPGEWILGTGVSVAADSLDGRLRLTLRADTSSLAPIGTAAGRLVVGGAFSLAFQASGVPRPQIDLSIGIAGAAPGRRAVHVEVGADLRVFLRPESGADLRLYPDPPGLGALLDAAIERALPFVLDHLAEQTGGDLAGHVGAVVRAVGDALNLRTGAPGAFDPQRLQAWADDPAGSLEAALPTLTSAALTAIASAVQPLLPSGATATVAEGELRVRVGPATLAWRPSPFVVTLGGAFTGVPAVETIDVAVALDASGLRTLTAGVGPAALDAGGVTLRPFARVAVGESPAGGRRIEIGLSADAGIAHAIVGRWHLDGSGLTLVAIDGIAESVEPARVASALVEAVIDIVASFALATPAVQGLLANPVGSTTVRDVLKDVVLDPSDPTHVDAGLFASDQLLDRLKKLGRNLAGAEPSIDIGGGLTIGLGEAAGVLTLILGVEGRIPLNQQDVVISIEADSRWIKDQPSAGFELGLLDASSLAFAPSVTVNGIGLRVSRKSGPLLDIGVTLGSVAVHLFGAVRPGLLSGGVQLQLSDLAVGVSGAKGGNPIAQGLMADAGKGPNKLAPSFSPALAVQKHSGGPVLVSLSAGEGSGPWWLAIQKAFGPIYIEQVGLGVTLEEQQLERISLLLDGRVSLFGLTAAVDDLQLTYVVASDASVFDPSRWAVDLAGLAIDADLGGIVLAGGLRKFGDGDNVEYVGMLLARFAVYGLSVYGGYGSGVVDGDRFAAFFVFGAVNGPIGGPPAFFVTGIGGGFGINRALVLPKELATFGEFPFIKALDPAAAPSPDPMAELARLRDYFPTARGQFWFAAGISFTSFALVDGVAVVAISIGDGFEISLLGLARMALPRPQFPLVSIELGLVARFSTREGVLWIQAQLTDNSWILNESVRLTGGFAFVMWFTGPNRGQFVLTLGGFHPRFKRAGYPNVPRLGFHWDVDDDIVVKGESYFALTSEALMAGGELSASADWGSAWAHVKFGANGIIYFDPFWLEVEAYARVSAGVTIDVWIGEITIKVSIGAKIVVSGPRFRGRAHFDVGPVGLTVQFGSSNSRENRLLSWSEFARKYLEEASPGVARVIGAIPGKGSLPPGTGPGGATETATADGTAQRPFEVFSEFEITVTTTVPTVSVVVAGVTSTHTPSRALGVAPMGIAAANSSLDLHLFNSANAEKLGALLTEVRKTGAFPIGVWGAPQPDDDRKVPKGDIIQAVEAVRFEARAALRNTLPKEIKYNQLDPPGPRKPLPFVYADKFRPGFLAAADAVTALLPDASDAQATFAAATPWLARAGVSRTTLAALARDRSSPPRLGSLTQQLAHEALPPPAIDLPDPAVPPPVDTRVLPPRAIAILKAEHREERAVARTTVSSGATVPRVPAPTLAAIQATQPLAVAAQLVRLPAAAAATTRTFTATGAVPVTRPARSSVSGVAARGSYGDARARLDAVSASLYDRSAATGASVLHPGEIAVLQLPNAIRDLGEGSSRPRLVPSGTARAVACQAGGTITFDGPLPSDGLVLSTGTERVAVLAIGIPAPASPGLLGWHSGQELAYIGWASALGAGAVVRAEGATIGRTRQRFRAGWIHAAELVAGTAIVSTRFREAVTAVAIVLDDPIDSEAARGLSLTLDGANRASNPDGSPAPPAIVAIGNRSVLVYDIVPDPAVPRNLADVVTVSVLSQDGWHLAGVLGSSEGSALIIERVVANGLDAVLQPLVQSAGGTVQLVWIPPATPTPAPTPDDSLPEAGRAGGTRAVRQAKSKPGKKTSRSRKTTRRKPSAKTPATRKSTGRGAGRVSKRRK